VSNEERSDRESEKDAELLPVMLEPREGKSDQAVLDWLKHKNVDAEILADRFISANIPPKLLGAVEQIAHISIKPRKRLR